MKRIIEFLQEANGQLSMTRLSILLILTVYIGWGTFIVATKGIIPDLPPSLAACLVGLYGFNTANINLNFGKDPNDHKAA